MYGSMRDDLRRELKAIHEAGLFKDPRPISSAQSAHVTVGSERVLNFCSNNYLGLADHPDVITAGQKRTGRMGIRHGLGSLHLRHAGSAPSPRRAPVLISRTEDTILYGSCFDANGGVFETLLGAEDAVISDALNHASIIDGIRLSKARRYRYNNRDMDDLERQLLASQDARHRIIVTDGVFSMDGYIAPLREICDLAERHGALVMVDDSHAVGFVGETGAGTPELLGVQDRVDIMTGTFGKALGGASGGYVSGHSEVVELLRQRSRPYLFSNSVAPSIVGATLRVLGFSETAQELLGNCSGTLRSSVARSATLGSTSSKESTPSCRS